MARPSSPVRSKLSLATFAQSSFSSDVVALRVCLSASFEVHGIRRPPLIRSERKTPELYRGFFLCYRRPRPSACFHLRWCPAATMDGHTSSSKTIIILNVDYAEYFLSFFGDVS